MSNTDVKDTPENAAANTPPSGQGAPVDTVRASAQAGDPYRPGESNDYTLNVDPGDSGEATIANLYQAVPLEHEGFGDPLLDEGSGDSEGSGSGDGSGLGGGSGLGLPPVQPSGNLSVVPTSDAAPAGAPDGGGGGDAPAARGLDATLPQFALGGDGVDAGGQNVGPGIGSGSGDPEAFATPTDGTPDDFGNDGTPDDDGDDEDPDDGPDDDDPEIDNSPIGPVTDTDLAANEFDEDVGPGTVVGLTGFAEDPDAGDTVTYAIDDPRFVIDPDTGVVTVAPNAEFDAETEPSITVVVTATSSDGSSSSETFTFNVLDVNENPIGPVTDENVSDNTIAEDATPGTVVGITAFAEDPDVSDDVTYSIDGDPRFEIDPETGVITVADGASFDAETESTASVTVTATSDDGSTSTETFEIAITDVNENPIGPVTDENVSDNTIAEDATPGTVVGITAFAEDPDVSDDVTYSIDGDPRFEIDPETGVITVADGASFDAETGSTASVTVTATSDDGSTSTETFEIAITDVNENPIGPVTDENVSDNTIAEDATPGTVVGITAFAEDPDVSDDVTYSIDGDPRFEIDPETGVITVADGASFDAETESTASVTVTATSDDGSTSTETFEIAITDVNENPIGPVTDENVSDNTIAEDATPGTVVGITAFAEDPDVSDDVTYSIDGDPRFEIDPETGVITVADGASFDAETESTASVTVTATSDDGSTSTETFEIAITDANEFPIGPVTDENVSDNTIAEDATPGTVVGITAFAEDPDVSDDVTYSIDGDPRFEIDPETGVITVADGASFDAETESTASVTVTATSDDGSTSTETFEIAITDANEFPIGPVTDENVSDNTIAEDATPGTVVGITAFAEDPDVSDDVTYSIDGDPRFEIDPETGVITVADGASFDAETESTASVTVTATSDDGSTSTETFEIEITDANEFPIGPVSDSDTTGNVVDENGTGGEYTGVTAFADDPDVTDVVSYEITGGDDRFDIDPDTGEITVKDGVSFDYETETEADVEVTATSSDGTTSTGTFTVNIADVNEAPDLVVEYGDVGTNLIKNGSFESFDVDSGTWNQFAEDNSGAWTTNGNMEIWDNFNGVSATEGDQHLELDSEKNVNSISQTVETSLGQVYDLSFDVQARRDDDSNTVEVYWNGELVTSVDPEKGSWETVELQVVGTGGSDVLEFRETSEDNDTYGAFIDNVELTGTDRIAIVEETPGVEVVPLSVIDPDAGDTHTFSVSDDRFEVVAKDGKYVLKLKDDQELDYETETQVTLQVTATDQGGLSDTETIVIDVIDIVENTEPIGPVSDVDNASNSVMENAAAATVVGITAFATDADAGDSVTYSITDDRFDIDPETGVVTVADGAEIDRETTPTIDIEVTATSTDGSTSSKTFTIEVGDDTTEFSIGPVSDVDDAANQISETADGGEDTGLTAFAEDKDATDTVTYELSGDDRFEIDENTGVVTVKDGAEFDAETEPTVTVTVTATSTDGSSKSKDFDIDVQDGNEAPDLIVHLEDGSKEFIVNGSFELFSGTMSGTDGTGWYDTPDTIDGWTYQDVDIHQADRHGEGATDGDHRLDLTADDNGTISQEFDGMLDGQVYNLSFDLNSRGNTPGEGVAEVYWNGELIDTLDPTDLGADWQSYSFDIVGGSGDGTNTLTFVDKGSDNSHGVYIDSVSIKSDNRTAILEEFEGAEVAPLSVIDPDAGDTHTFKVSDDRFEVVEADGKYLLKLKDDQALDYETEQQVTVEVTATDSGGLSDTETIVIDVIDIDENTAPVGPVSDVDDAKNSVMENAAAATVVGITAFATDADAGDTVTYSVTDDRFEIDPDTGVITVADGADLDRETTPTIDVEVTATSTDGSTSSKTFTIEVGDDNTEFSIGPVTDKDDASNQISETADGGENTGITAFAEDQDATDTVTYELSGDDRFEIDENSGVITVKDGASFDAETEPTVTVAVTATSTDGSSSTKDFTLDVTDGNEAPDLSFDPELGPGVSVTLTFMEETAGYKNTIGVFQVDENGDPVSGEIVWVDHNTLNKGDSATVYLEGAKEADIGFFLIPDGASKNSGLQSGDQVTFEKDSDGNWQAVLEDGTKLEGRNANVFFSGDGSLNPDGFDQTFENGIEIGFEDIAGGGDKDFDDPVFTGETFGTAATAAVYEEELGADVGGLTVVDPDVGDTHTFTISDDRFEVVEQNGEYTLKLKDNEALDYETETQVTVQVTATDTGGLSDTETIVIDVIDIDDAPGSDIGPLRDSDAASNTITDKAVGGETVGITALADDPDLEDDVTYELAGDDRFEIDENTGVITVKDGASFDGDKETGVDLTVTANSTDGTSSTETFTVEITDGNEAPDLVVEYGDVGNNLIKNGSFETFDVADASFRQFEEDSSGAWTSSGKMEIWDNYQGVNATEGDQHLELDSENNVNSISQMVETSLGQVYDLSLDVQARTDDASNTVEIYWNGELVSSVDPVTGSWQTIELQVVGTGGNDVLEFRETSEDNNTFGAFIDNVELTGTDRLGVVEETPGAKVVPLSVVDPDIGDTHTFTVSDDRFEVVEANGEYLLKLKDDKALDYETETQVTLQVTATDEGGLSDTETIVIDVIDIEEVPGADVGPVSDIDGTKNSVMENAAAATVVGITAFATDADAGDTVTYSITDDRFEIDPDTGVITVADGADLDRETTPTIDVEVTATSTDGSTSSKTFTIEVGDDNTEFSIGPVADKDDASNQISETADGGENTGITAFAEDQDATDTVTYELSGDDRFEIDENSGVITVKDGASFDAETEQTVSVTVTATSTDGSTATKDFDIEITDGNEPPDLVVHLEDGSKQFVVNGSFEVFDGPLGGSDGTGFYQNPDSIEGWIYENVDVHQAGHLGFGATDGDHHLDLAALTNGEASQAIDGMMSGQVYELTFDMKSRGDIGQSVAEVYWNGELIETIDPAKTGSDWQTYTFDLIGGAGDGTDTLTFVEIGSDNNGGALIDSVSITSDSRIAVLEEFEGAEIAPLSVIDPDAGDTHTVTVSDDRFEVVEANGKYLLKLKDDQSLDYETEQQVTVQVTAADSGGLSDTETVVIDVIDIPEDVLNTDIGPVKDIDQSANMVLAGAAAGVVVGITAFADDVDAGDTVTYSITDERFEIDEETGVVTVAKWAELTPGDDISLEVTATSSDGSTSSKTFEIEVGPDNKPVVANDDAATVGLTTTSFYYSDDDGELHVISSDGSDTVIGSTGVGALTDVAIDSSGKLFGITFSRLYSVDPQTGEATKISSSKFGTSMNALEFAPDGTLYAASTNGKLYTVDVDTGKSTLVGEMEFESAGDLAFAGNKLYLSASDGSIVEIDPASGATVAVVATLPVSNAFGLVGDPAGQLYAFTSGGKVFQVDPETGSVSTPDNYVMNDSGWGATETADSDGQTGFVEGDVLANDVDPEGSMTVTGILFGGQEFATGTKIDSDYGSLTISADGSYTYVLDPDSAAAQALGVGTSDEEVFTYTVTDDGGNTDSATLTITVNGYADGAEVSAVDDEPVRLRAEGSDKDDDDILAKGTGDDEGDVESAAVATNDDDGQEGLEQTGTNEADTLEGGAGADALYGLDGNDILIGNEGADRLDGGAGNDLFKGGKGDDEMVGDDGNDMFAYAMGDGNDSISGGTGSWIDVIDLADGADGTPLGEYGADWTITVTEGSIETLADGSITLAENSDGYIELADGAKVDFSDVESVSY